MFRSLETLPAPSHFSLPLFQREHLHPSPSSEKSEEEDKGEEEEEEERNSEEAVDLTDSSDEFEVFNQTIHSKDEFNEIGVQRKP